MNISKSFSVGTDATLTLKNLYANVQIRPGVSGQISIEVNGPDQVVSRFNVQQFGNGAILHDPRGYFSVNIGGYSGGDYVGGDYVGGNQINVGDISGQGINIGTGNSLGGDRILTGNISGTDINIGSQTSSLHIQPAEIEIHVPQGTTLSVETVYNLFSANVHGPVSMSLSGKNNAYVIGALGIGLRLSGSSAFQASDVNGGLNLSLSGSSEAELKGNFGDVSCVLSGAASVVLNGNCGNTQCETQGSAGATFNGDMQDLTANSSGSSRISVNGGCQVFSGVASGSASINVRGGASSIYQKNSSISASIRVQER